jgi:hypothetical protein
MHHHVIHIVSCIVVSCAVCAYFRPISASFRRWLPSRAGRGDAADIRKIPFAAYPQGESPQIPL